MGKPRLRHHSRREESQQEKRNGRRDEGRVGEKSFLPHLVEISSPSSEPQSDNREYARFSTPAPSPSAVLLPARVNIKGRKWRRHLRRVRCGVEHQKLEDGASTPRHC